jgi:hypothetical protein
MHTLRCRSHSSSQSAWTGGLLALLGSKFDVMHKPSHDRVGPCNPSIRFREMGYYLQNCVARHMNTKYGRLDAPAQQSHRRLVRVREIPPGEEKQNAKDRDLVSLTSTEGTWSFPCGCMSPRRYGTLYPQLCLLLLATVSLPRLPRIPPCFQHPRRC